VTRKAGPSHPVASPAALPVAAAAVTSAGSASVKVGCLVSGSKPAALMVDFAGNAAGPLAARSVLALDEASIRDAIAMRQSVVLLFENGDPRLPIVAGLVPPEPGAALLGSLLHPPAPAAPAKPTEARVDGKRVVLEGEQEVVLRCGDASITLRRDGKLILRGAYIETTSKGLNRIRGGSVKIN
jgi:hypothetical protein